MKRPAALEALSESLSSLPGIGAVTSERLAYHLLSVPEKEALALADAIRRARAEIRLCSVCANLDQEDPCRICQDPDRNRKLLLVVESPRDVLAFEASGFRGLYHVLQGRLSPLEGVSAEDLNLSSLLERTGEDDDLEVCVATNPDLEGEATSQAIKELLRETGLRVTRIARGIPAGASITQVQQTILADALEGRRPLA